MTATYRLDFGFLLGPDDIVVYFRIVLTGIPKSQSLPLIWLLGLLNPFSAVAKVVLGWCGHYPVWVGIFSLLRSCFGVSRIAADRDFI